ncbi:MAG: hypothetical protein K2M47_02880 [Clostridiales bacterium]|nr:hypothetical protein [Clostridiales bacterium]
MKSKDKVVSEKHIDCDMLLDNAPVESDDYGVEAQVLDAQIRKKGVNNIAVVAPYGAGKSSAITTYIKRYRKSGIRKPKYVQISLADFNQDGEQSQSEYKENAIERSILQQLLYNQKKHKLPNSTLNRTNKTRIRTLLWYSFWSVVLIFAAVALIFETSGNSFFGYWKYTSSILTALTTISVVFLIISLLYTGKLRKIKYKDLEVSLDKDGKPQGDVSLINKFIDEVLYFFECINVDLIIFEDLDRFESLKIFVKLRELNTIINNSPRKAEKVTFVYAVKDTMFKDENQRAKFFEFILPVIPIINPITTADQIRSINDKLTKKDVSLRLSEQFIKDISYYVDDMRVLKNAFNDYIMMTHKLSENTEKRLNKRHENLFALALYKNLYPYDYARLQHNEGLIPLCIDKNRLVAQFVQTKKDDIKELEAEKDRIKKEALNNFAELKLLFKGQHCKYPTIYGHSNVLIDNLESFKGVNTLDHPMHSGYSVAVQKLPSGETYYEREQIIKGKGAKRIVDIDYKINFIKQTIESEENDTFSNLIDRMGIDIYFSDENVRDILDKYVEEIVGEEERATEDSLSRTCEEKVLLLQFAFIRMLINKRYIGEDYLEYISNYCSEITVKDMEFIRNVKRGYLQSYSYRLDDITSVIKSLNEEDFSQSAILIKDVLNSLNLVKELDVKEEIKTHKFDAIMRLLASGKKNVVNAVKEFLALTNDSEKSIFADNIAIYAGQLVENLFEANICDNDKDIFISALINYSKYEVLKSDQLKRYIEMHSNYSSLFSWPEHFFIPALINDVDLKFEVIDLSNGRDKLFDYIVRGNYYQMNIPNLQIVLDVKDDDAVEFSSKNYSFIRNSGKDCLVSRIENDINNYIEQIYLKLPLSNEDEYIIRELLSNEQISVENKVNIIEHTEFKLKDFDSIDTQLYSAILNGNKIEARWDNVATAYKTVGVEGALAEFISLNLGNIDGSYSSIDSVLQTELFNTLIELSFDEAIFGNLAKCIDCRFKMNGIYGKCKNIKQFILAGLFEFNIGDMQFLTNPPSILPYLACYQDNILGQMKDFFGVRQFKNTTCENIIDEQLLSLRFKKEFLELYGSDVDITGIELKIAEFIVVNSCAIGEDMLYKFIDVNLESTLKLQLLALAIKQNKINNLAKYREYFSSIGEDYSKLIKEGERMTVENNGCNRLIAHFMKENGICDCNQRKEKIYYRSA